jgi:hypothetical protein
MYPNPSDGNFYKEVKKKAEMKIYNSIVEIISEIQIKSGINSVSTGNVPSELYFMILDSESFAAKIFMIKNSFSDYVTQ